MKTFVLKLKCPLSALLSAFILSSLLLSSCNDNTITRPSSPDGSLSSPTSTEETPTPTPDNYTDLPVVECDHEKIPEDYSYIKVLDSFSKADLFTLTFSKEDSDTLTATLNEGTWVKGDIDLEGQWYIRAALDPNSKDGVSIQNDVRFLHYSEQGIFFKYVYGKNDLTHLILTDRQRDTVNGILAKYKEQPTPLPDPADAQAVLAYIEEKSDRSSLWLSSRTDFADPTAMDKISLDTPYESLKDLIGTYHFVLSPSSQASVYWNYPCYTEFFVLSDGRLLELKIKTDRNEWGNIASRTIIGKRSLTITDFDKEYLTRITDETDEQVAWLRKAMPLLSGLHILTDTPFTNDLLSYTADFSQNDALDPALIDQIEKGMHAPEVYDILGSPHVSHREHSNQLNSARAWYALPNGRILEVRYTIDYDITEDEKEALRTEYALSDKAFYYKVSAVEIYDKSSFIDLYRYILELSPWRGSQW